MTPLRILATLVIALATTAGQAGEVLLKGAHLCCGQCDKAATAALKSVEGVSEISIDETDDKKTITFQVDDGASADKAIKSLSSAGFFGKAVHEGKAVKFPKTGAKKKGSVDNITLYSVHLCCGQCVKGTKKALDKVKGIETVEPDMKKGEIVVTGKEIKVTEIMQALHKAGFQASLTPPKKKEAAEAATE